MGLFTQLAMWRLCGFSRKSKTRKGTDSGPFSPRFTCLAGANLRSNGKAVMSFPPPDPDNGGY
jgi:hypothetical protein